MSKFFVEFSVPVYCSCIIEAESEEEAWEKVGDYNISQLKKLGCEIEIVDHKFDNKECDVIKVKPFLKEKINED